MALEPDWVSHTNTNRAIATLGVLVPIVTVGMVGLVGGTLITATSAALGSALPVLLIYVVLTAESPSPSSG